MEDFPPLPSALGLDQAFCEPRTVCLVIKQDLLWSGGDFAVSTAEGREVVHCEGKAMTMSGRRTFFTPQGSPLYTLRMQKFSWTGTWYLETPAGERFLDLKAQFSFAKKLSVTFNNVLGDGKEVRLEIRGGMFSRKCEICWDDLLVARTKRDFTFGGSTYGVEVAPGVDLALIAALVVGIDMYTRAKSSSSGGGG